MSAGAAGLTALSERLGVSRQYLSREAKAAGVRLAALARRWTAILALEAREAEGAKWERVAGRCGYEGLTGLSELFKRQFELRLREARSLDIVELMDDFGGRLRGHGAE